MVERNLEESVERNMAYRREEDYTINDSIKNIARTFIPGSLYHCLKDTHGKLPAAALDSLTSVLMYGSLLLLGMSPSSLSISFLLFYTLRLSTIKTGNKEREKRIHEFVVKMKEINPNGDYQIKNVSLTPTEDLSGAMSYDRTGGVSSLENMIGEDE